jgi:hypothetical protein
MGATSLEVSRTAGAASVTNDAEKRHRRVNGGSGVNVAAFNSLRGFGHHDGTSTRRMRTKSRLPSRAAPSQACGSRCLRRRPSTPSRSVSTSSLVSGSPVALPSYCEPSTETRQPRAFPFERPSNLGFDHSRRLVRPPQAPNRGLLDRQRRCPLRLCGLPWSTCYRRTLRKTEPQQGPKPQL